MNDPIKVELVGGLDWLSPVATLLTACVALGIAIWSSRRSSSISQVERASESIAQLALMESRFRGTFHRSIPKNRPTDPAARAKAQEAVSEYNRRWGQSVEEASALAFTFLDAALYEKFSICRAQATLVLDAMTNVINSLDESTSPEAYGAARKDLENAADTHFKGVDAFRETVREKATRSRGTRLIRR